MVEVEAHEVANLVSLDIHDPNRFPAPHNTRRAV